MSDPTSGPEPTEERRPTSDSDTWKQLADDAVGWFDGTFPLMVEYDTAGAEFANRRDALLAAERST